MGERPRSLDWVDALKAMALLGVLLNHLVETFGPGPWFTNPSQDWPDLATRLRSIFPSDGNPLPALVRFGGWLGDSGPGVFVLLSGFGLTWGGLRAPQPHLLAKDFYRRRLLRLFPLYVGAHFAILAMSLVVPGERSTLASPNTLLSLAGLRFTEGLFFYLSPSWWFVWLILQLYLVFPLLHSLLLNLGVPRFLAIACVFTFACRGLGLLGWIPNHNLYFWMTGLFFGTRLAEFAVGMALAVILWRRQERKLPPPAAGRCLALALPTYLAGFGCSLTWPGTLVSNLLVTLGLAGLFYALWEGLTRLAPLLRAPLLWLGKESYGIYLLHQPPLLWAAALLGGRPRLQLLVAVAVLAASLPAALLLRRFVERVEVSLEPPAGTRALRIAVAVALPLAVACLMLDGTVTSPRLHRTLALLIGIAAIPIGMRELTRSVPGIGSFLRTAALAASFLGLFVLTPGLGPLALGGGVVVGGIDALARALFGGSLLVRATPVVVSVLLVTTGEAALRRWAPLEAGRWGEFPALEPHPTRVYGLRPNAETHLRYNNYDYKVRTNSLGLASPEIALDRPTPDTLRVLVVGDAFSMPEGLEYPSSYPALLEQRLRECLAPRAVQVINAGVTGYGPVEEVPQLRELAPLLRPDVVVWQFFVNEFEEVLLTPEERRANIGFPVPGVRVGLRGRLQLVARARWFQDRVMERITGRPGRWRYEKALLHFYESGPNDSYSPARLGKLRSTLEAMQHAAGGAGARLLVYFVPGAVAVSRPADIAYFPWGEDLEDSRRYDLSRPARSLQALAGPLGVPVVDLTPDLRQHRPQPVYYPESWHWNAEGHRLVADVVVRTLAERGVLDGRCGR